MDLALHNRQWLISYKKAGLKNTLFYFHVLRIFFFIKKKERCDPIILLNSLSARLRVPFLNPL